MTSHDSGRMFNNSGLTSHNSGLTSHDSGRMFNCSEIETNLFVGPVQVQPYLGSVPKQGETVVICAASVCSGEIKCFGTLFYMVVATCLSVCLSKYIYVYTSICLYVCLSNSLFAYPYTYLYQNINLSNSKQLVFTKSFHPNFFSESSYGNYLLVLSKNLYPTTRKMSSTSSRWRSTKKKLCYKKVHKRQNDRKGRYTHLKKIAKKVKNEVTGNGKT